MNDLIEKIKSNGYWKVVIRPTVFVNDRIPVLRECRKIVEESSVLLRGWDYPHFDLNSIENAIDYVGLKVEFMEHFELWRQYQSGQFVHLFACFEDYLDRSQFSPSLSIRTQSPDTRYLSILSTLYTLTEIFLFASRLASKEILDPSCEISISLHGMKNRQLFFFDKGRLLRRNYICNEEYLPYTKVLEISELLVDFDRQARIALLWFFERFNWNDFTEGFFIDEQKKYLERNV